MSDEKQKRNLLGEMGQGIDDTLKRFQPPPKIIKSNKKLFLIAYVTGCLTGGALVFFLFRMWELFI